MVCNAVQLVNVVIIIGFALIGDVLKADAVSESVVYLTHRVGDCERSKRRAVVKSVFVDRNDAAAYRDAFQICAVVKCILADFGHTVWNCIAVAFLVRKTQKFSFSLVEQHAVNRAIFGIVRVNRYAFKRKRFYLC